MGTIAVIGFTGFAGGHITEEALRRGHEVIGVSRTGSADPRPGVSVRQGDIGDVALLATLAAEADTVVVAVHGAANGQPYLASLVPALLDAVVAGDARLGVVGGASSLDVARGGPRLFDTPEFPEMFKVEAQAHIAVLEALRSSDAEADWFYVSPSATFGAYAPGERTGAYRTGDDVLLVGPDGNSFIGGADFAIAVLDEIENPVHHRTRFTVGY
ncbi:MAG: NAD(P)H-binding protein [Acidobacteriota bacterium]|nr:NAD(P)H-binding protein [Acidobacteriota bacterium]